MVQRKNAAVGEATVCQQSRVQTGGGGVNGSGSGGNTDAVSPSEEDFVAFKGYYNSAKMSGNTAVSDEEEKKHQEMLKQVKIKCLLLVIKQPFKRFSCLIGILRKTMTTPHIYLEFIWPPLDATIA